MNLPFFTLALFLSLLFPASVVAFDHADGFADKKTGLLDIADFYVFTERSQNLSAQYHQLIFVMTLAPHSLPKQQVFFSQYARYEFRVARVQSTKKNVKPNGLYDVSFRIEFSKPDSSNQQQMTVTATRSGHDPYGTSRLPDLTPILTTPIGATPVVNNFKLDTSDFAIFAGMREDPSFFDLRSFLNIRKALSNSGGTSIGSGFGNNTTSEDFTAGYNVNSIVLRVPRSFMQRSALDTVFDAWAVVSVSSLL